MGEAIFLLVLSLGIWFFTVFLPAWLQRRQPEAPRDVGPQTPPPSLAPRPRPLQAARAVVPSGTPVSVTPLVGMTRRPAPTRLGSRQDMRRGIVLMTLLSPCRALEPPEPPR